MRPSVTVVVPNYNHALFIGASLRSIIPQLRDGDELIVIDDASRDDSVAVIAGLIAGVPGARLERHAVNQGALATLNEGLALASKPYICFPAADDIVVDGAVDRALRLLTTFPDAGFCSGFVRVIDEAGKDLGPLPTRMVRDQASFLTPAEVAAELMFDDSWIVGLAFYRADYLRAAGGFRPELSNFTDGYACRLVAVRHGCCYIPAPFQLWRRMSEGLSWQETIDMQHVETIAARALPLLDHAYDENFPPGYARRWRGRWRFGAKAFALKNVQHRRWLALLNWADRRHPTLKRLLLGMMAVARGPQLLALFAVHRPQDIWAVARRRLLGKHVA